MTPQTPPSSEESSLPPRHRPTQGSFSQDTTEQDLWAFDDDPDMPSVPETAKIGLRPRMSGRDIPAPRERQPGKPHQTDGSPSTKPPAGDGEIQIDVNKSVLETHPFEPSSGQAKSEGDFDELENWGFLPIDPQIADLPAEILALPVEPVNPPELVAAAAAPEAPEATAAPAPGLPQITPDILPPSETKTEEDDEFSPVLPEHAVPLSLRPRLKLSPVEWLGLIFLLAVILAGAGAILVFSLKHLPTETQRAKAHYFPIQGSQLTIDSATTYWRVPILEGASRDTFRRGTQLLPVLEISVSGGPATLRVLFRNEDKVVVGDAVTRTFRDGGLLQIPATAGFDNLGMYAAYRTGESKPWTVEVLEAPAETAAGTTFTKLFEMNIATVRR
jgi:hypothetical protein